MDSCRPGVRARGGAEGDRPRGRRPGGVPGGRARRGRGAASAPAPERERVGIPFVTIDPPGARDLDQMLHIERRGDGYRVHYAIADPGVFITPGGALDRDTHARGGVRLAVPEQEVVQDGGGWTVHYRVPLASEEHNAQISLLTGTAAAALMLQAGVGILRTQPPPEERALARLRRTAAALGVDWPQGRSYAEFIRGLDPAIPAHAAIMHEATGVGRGVTYTPFDGAPPA